MLARGDGIFRHVIRFKNLCKTRPLPFEIETGNRRITGQGEPTCPIVVPPLDNLLFSSLFQPPDLTTRRKYCCWTCHAPDICNPHHDRTTCNSKKAPGHTNADDTMENWKPGPGSTKTNWVVAAAALMDVLWYYLQKSDRWRNIRIR